MDLDVDINMNDLSAVRDYMIQKVNRPFHKWYEIPKPVIAAVNGVAVGGGCNLALLADLVLASSEDKD